MTSPPCLTAEDLEGYTAGTLPPHEAKRAREHVNRCDACKQLVEEGTAHVHLLAQLRDAVEQADVGPPLQPSQMIEGYEIIRELSRGGQGVVYEALHKATKRKVALKVLVAGAYAAKPARKRFEREIELVAQLKHPNIITVFHSGVTPDGQQFCVMDYIRGKPLHKYVREKKLALEETLGLFATVCEAVQYAHQRGIIHRDLKPTNIMVDAEGSPKILDFGLAKQMAGPVDTIVSVSRQIIGTVPYMSPEQIGGNPDEIETRTDVYALGVMLYELLTGHYPYSVDGPITEVLRRVTETAPTSPRSAWTGDAGVARRLTRRVRPGECPIDGEVDTILLKALAKERERRYQSAGELARDIRHYLTGDPIEARRDSGWYVLRKALRRHKVPVAAVIVLLFLISGSAVALIKYNEQTRRLARAVEAEREAERWLYGSRIALAQIAYNDGDVTRMRELLAQCPDKLRRWEWNRLQWLADRSELTFPASEGRVLSVAYSPDGRQVVSSGSDGTLRVWATDTGKVLQRVAVPSGAFTAGGGVAQSRLEFLPVAFGPEGLVAAGSADGTVRVWDAGTGDRRATLAGHSFYITSVAFSPDGKQIASGSADTTIRLWEWNTGRLLRSFRAHDGRVLSVAFSPDGNRVVSGGEDALVKMWDVTTPEPRFTLEGHLAGVWAVAFSPDGTQVISGSEDRSINLWDAAWGRLIRPIGSHRAIVRSVAFNHDGTRIVSAGDENTIRLWTAATGTDAGAIPPRPTGRDFALKIQQLGAGGQVESLRGHEDLVRAVAFSPDGTHVVSGSRDGTVKLWNAVHTDDALTLVGHSAVICSLAVSPDGGRIVSAGFNRTPKLWDMETGEELHTLYGHRGVASRVVFSPDGARIVSGDDTGTIRVWAADTGQPIRSFSAHEGGITSLAISRYGASMVSASHDHTIKLWDADTGNLIKTLPRYDKVVWAVALDPDGRRIVSGDTSGTLIVWDLATGDAVRAFRGHTGDVYAVVFRPDGEQFVSAGADGTLKLWELGMDKELRTFRGHRGEVFAVAVSPDGMRIASGGTDRTIRLWNTDTGAELLALRGHYHEVRDVAFSPMGGRIISGSADCSLKIWDTERVPLERLRERMSIARARDHVDSLYRQHAFADEVRARIETDRTLGKPVRQAALRLTASRGDDPQLLNNGSWDVVKWPGADDKDYERALQMAEHACETDPDNPSYLNTLGVAQYRVGQHDAALDSLARSDSIFIELGQGNKLANLAAIALAEYQLGRIDDARMYLEQAREASRTRGESDPVVSRFLLSEAESLIPGPDTARPVGD